MSSAAASYDITVDRGSDWSKVLTLRDLNADPVPITDIFTVAVSVSGTTSPSVVSATLTYVSSELWSTNGNATAPGSGTWVRVRRSGGAWEITHWVNGVQSAGYWVSATNPNHPAWVESWTAAGGATGEPEVDSAGMFFEGSISLQERGPDAVPFVFDTVGDGTAGQVEISLPRSYTRALAGSGAYRFDWFVYQGRTRVRIVAGRVAARGSSTGTSTGVPIPAFGASPAVSWGSITGTLSNQTDLQAALDAAAAGGGGIETIDIGTPTTFTGYIYGDGTETTGATVATDSDAGDTLVLRGSLGGVTASYVTAVGGQSSFSSTTTSGATAYGNSASWLYGAGRAAAHRTALGSTVTGDALFIAATASSARTTLGSGTGVGDTVFTATTAKGANEALLKTTRIKTTQTDRSLSATYTTDSDFTHPVTAGKTYRVEFAIYTTATVNSGFKGQFTLPSVPAMISAAANGVGMTTQPGGAVVAMAETIAGVIGVAALTRSGSAINGTYHGFFEVTVGVTGGNLLFQWAQVASHADLTSVLANSAVTVIERTP